MPILDLREPVSALTHGLGMLLSLPATLVLWRRGGDLVSRLGLGVFGFTLAFCYAASAAFHAIPGPIEQIREFDRIDHLGIFLLIAGTYTPLAVCVFRGWWRRGILVAAWILATAGGALDLATDHLSIVMSTVLYMAMGWGAIFCCFELARALSFRSLRPLFVGGLLYTAGALINLFRWPTLVPGVLGPHELLHLLVMAGSLAHFWFMIKVVAPFAQRTLNTRPQAVAASPSPAIPAVPARGFSLRPALVWIKPDRWPVPWMRRETLTSEETGY